MPVSRDDAIRLGGKPWRGSYGPERVYLNDDVWGPMIGLSTTWYKSGNLRGASVGDTDISNRQGYELMRTKVWVQDGQVYVKPGSEHVAQYTRGIKAAVEAAAAPRAAAVSASRLSGS